MDKQINGHITALGVHICVVGDGTQDDFISITDIARYKSDEPKMVIQNWMRNRNTIEFLGVWEEIHNPLLKASNSMPLKARVCGIRVGHVGWSA